MLLSAFEIRVIGDCIVSLLRITGELKHAGQTIVEKLNIPKLVLSKDADMVCWTKNFIFFS